MITLINHFKEEVRRQMCLALSLLCQISFIDSLIDLGIGGTGSRLFDKQTHKEVSLPIKKLSKETYLKKLYFIYIQTYKLS